MADTRRVGVDKELREAILTGRLVDLRSGDATADDPAHGADWSHERTVPATLLAELLTSTDGSRRPRALQLEGARIVGQLNLEATELSCPLLLLSCWFAEPVVLDQARAPAVRLLGCHLPGMTAQQLTTRGNLQLSSATVTGEVNLSGAHIGGQLAFDGATLTNLTNPNGYALDAQWVTVDQGMVCTRGFAAIGEVRLVNAHIGGQLAFEGATLTNPNGRALHLQELRAGSLFLRDLTQPPELVVFTHAQVGALVDEPTSWPHKAYLDGFVYEALSERTTVSARQRLDWLARDRRRYRPQPYEQLAAVYRRAGRDQDVRTVAIAKQRARRRTLGLAEQVWSVLLDGLVGYGYRTWLAGIWLVGLWLVGTILFDVAHSMELLTAAKAEQELQHFNALVYALDLLLPIVNLGQDGGWVPHRWAAVCSWLLTLAGWVLTTAVVAALTGLLKRD